LATVPIVTTGVLAAEPRTRRKSSWRFLSTHDQIANVFARRSDHDPATKFPAVHGQAFAT
jgi:hypothetical protein